MGGITPTEGPMDAGNVNSQPMAINPNQRTFQSFNPNLPSNLYGNVITGKSNYNYTPGNNMSSVVTDTGGVGSGSVGGGGGGLVSYPGEVDPQQQIADRIDNNRAEVDAVIAAGNGSIAPVPNVLDASQSDDLYNQYFQENFKAAQDHAEGNPYGQTTGVPLSQQGFTTGASLLPPVQAETLTDKFLQSITGPLKENKVTSYSHATDNDGPAGPGDTGYEQAQLLSNLQGGGTGIIYKDDRREVYLDGVLIGNPKRAETADRMLAEAKAAKAAAAGYNNGTPMVTQNYNYGTNMVTPGGK